MRGRLRLSALALVGPALRGRASAEPGGAFAEFLRWAEGRGATAAPGLGVGVDPATGLRGLLAGEGAKEGDELFSLPSGLVLTTELVQGEGVAWQQCAGSEDDELLSPGHTAFALFILEQRAAGAPFEPWTRVLPDSFPGHPLFFSVRALDELQASPLRKVVELDRGSVEHDHRLAKAARPNLTLDEFQWARTAVKSRVFGLKSLSGHRLASEVIAMVPLADFVNHPPDGVVEANAAPSYDVDSGTFRFRAVRAIGKGQGIYWDYGFKSNRHSLLRYGFASQERVALTDMPLFFRLTDFPATQGASKGLKLDLVDAARRDGLLAMEDDGTVMHELTLSLAGPDAGRLLGHMRFMVLEAARGPAQLRELCPATYCRPAGLQDERRALRLLSGILEALLSAYNTTAADDQELLGDAAAPGRDFAQWCAVVVRYGEKKVLRGFTRLLEALDPLFDLSPWALATAVERKWSNPASDIHQYVRENLTSLVETESLRWAKRKVKADKLKARS